MSLEPERFLLIISAGAGSKLSLMDTVNSWNPSCVAVFTMYSHPLLVARLWGVFPLASGDNPKKALEMENCPSISSMLIPWSAKVKKPAFSAASTSCLVISSFRFSKSMNRWASLKFGSRMFFIPFKDIIGTSLSAMILVMMSVEPPKRRRRVSDSSEVIHGRTRGHPGRHAYFRKTSMFHAHSWAHALLLMGRHDWYLSWYSKSGWYLQCTTLVGLLVG